MRYLNVIGAQVCKLRTARRWSQSKLAIQLQRCGWDASRETVSRIERRVYEIQDLQLLYLAEVFSVPMTEFFPPRLVVRNRDINEVMNSRV